MSATNPQGQTIISGTPTANSAVVAGLSGVSTARLLLSGTFTDAVVLEESWDGGTTYVATSLTLPEVSGPSPRSRSRAPSPSVVRQAIPPGSVVQGNPAKVVGNVEDLLRFWEAESSALPWADLVAR
jgi:hypothetical protein